MTCSLAPVVAALAALADRELDALIATVNDCPQFAPGFLAWVEHVCDWEQNRRQGLDFPPQPPEAAIEPSEDADSIDALAVNGRYRNAGSTEAPHGPAGHGWLPTAHGRRTLGT